MVASYRRLPGVAGIPLRDAARAYADPPLSENLIAAESAWCKLFGTSPEPVEYRIVADGSVPYLSGLDMWRALSVPVVPPLVNAREAVEADLIHKIETGVLCAFGHRDRVDAPPEQIEPNLFALLRPDPKEPGKLVGGGTAFWNVHVADPRDTPGATPAASHRATTGVRRRPPKNEYLRHVKRFIAEKGREPTRKEDEAWAAKNHYTSTLARELHKLLGRSPGRPRASTKKNGPE